MNVSNYFLPNSKQWDAHLIMECFLPEDAKAILSVYIPQRDVNDRLVWVDSSTCMYSAKTGYRFCQTHSVGTPNIPQCHGLRRIWGLLIPHKVKTFI